MLRAQKLLPGPDERIIVDDDADKRTRTHALTRLAYFRERRALNNSVVTERRGDTTRLELSSSSSMSDKEQRARDEGIRERQGRPRRPSHVQARSRVCVHVIPSASPPLAGPVLVGGAYLPLVSS